MNIRKARKNDVPDIDRLLFAVHDVHAKGRPDLFRPGCKKYGDEELFSLLDDPLRPIFVAEEEGRILGYVFLELQTESAPSHVPGKTLYIDDLCVEESARRRGVGKALFDFARGYAEAQGCRDLTLNVWACNPGAVEFYRKCGMQIRKYGMEILLPAGIPPKNENENERNKT